MVNVRQLFFFFSSSVLVYCGFCLFHDLEIGLDLVLPHPLCCRLFGPYFNYDRARGVFLPYFILVPDPELNDPWSVHRSSSLSEFPTFNQRPRQVSRSRHAPGSLIDLVIFPPPVPSSVIRPVDSQERKK